MTLLLLVVVVVLVWNLFCIMWKIANDVCLWDVEMFNSMKCLRLSMRIHQKCHHSFISSLFSHIALFSSISRHRTGENLKLCLFVRHTYNWMIYDAFAVFIHSNPAAPSHPILTTTATSSILLNAAAAAAWKTFSTCKFSLVIVVHVTFHIIMSGFIFNTISMSVWNVFTFVSQSFFSFYFSLFAKYFLFYI